MASKDKEEKKVKEKAKAKPKVKAEKKEAGEKKAKKTAKSVKPVKKAEPAEKEVKKVKKEMPKISAERKPVRSVARYIRTSARKLRLVVDAIRGKKVKEALNILRFVPKQAAKEVEKVIKSAVANAENNFQLNADALFINRAFVDVGPTMKRFIPRAMGRASHIHKRTSHITIEVMEKGA